MLGMRQLSFEDLHGACVQQRSGGRDQPGAFNRPHPFLDFAQVYYQFLPCDYTPAIFPKPLQLGAQSTTDQIV